jgi:hypothetical protein
VVLLRPFMGDGSLCQRTIVSEILDVVSAFARDLPSSHFHHFGVMLGIFTDKASLRPQVASTDTAAWNGRLGTGINEFDAVMVQRGWTQRRTEIQWALPRFVAKGNGALQWPKQLPIGL